MSAAGYALGIDLGTSHTVAMLRWPDGRVKPLLFDSSPLLPSAVYAPPGDGDLIVGRDALQHARFAPGRLEPNPKRRIDEVQVLLGEREVAVTALLAALLRHVNAEAHRVAGGARPAVAIAHPAGWGPVRRLVLADAAEAAGLGTVTFVPEPVAAAHFFTAVDHHRVPAGSALVVYDFGGGTFDATVIRDSARGFEVAAVDGLGDVGGVDIDAAVVDALRTAAIPAHEAAWKRLTEPATLSDTRARHLLWDDVRTGKEILSRATTVDIQVPTVDDGTTVSRADLERIAGPLVDRTVRTAGSLIRHAGLAPDRVAAVFLVGGSSRMPLVSRALHAALGVPPTVTEQPELVVAEGALYALPDDVTTAAPTSPAQPSPALRPAAVAGAAGPPAPGPAGPPAPGPAAVAGPDGPAAPGTPWAADAPTVPRLPRLRAGGAAPAVPLLAGPPTPSAPHRSPAPHPPVGPPAAARRRGHGFAVVLAALTTAILLIGAGLVSGVIRVPGPTGPADAADRPSASAPAVATGG